MKQVCYFIYLIFVFFLSCQGKKSNAIELNLSSERSLIAETYREKEKQNIEFLKKKHLYNYLDSAYWYFYIYYGEYKIKGCGDVQIDSILEEPNARRLIYHDLILKKVRLNIDSSLLFLSVSPVVNDSIFLCYFIDGNSLPNELVFNYKNNEFIKFSYDEAGWDIPLEAAIDYYKNILSRVLLTDSSLNLKVSYKFNKLYNSIILNKGTVPGSLY
ncbi:hypothetical protein [Polluticaenibacter yanchengensis]|uniref:Lipoprotein n=1 Tax=Polluticaenibacter yanchengensis TaxID=3014562 RepID=A0ABT4UL70_9BACT|nr:hypothetical protein [Chitinophagaceae bacterium LY-5]